MSKIKVDQIEGSTGSSITIPTGHTLTVTDGLSASTISHGTLADARLPASALNSNIDLTNLSASNLTSGTVSDARLPSTALNSNVDLTNLSASNLTSGTVSDARLPATALNSNVDLTNLSASNLTSGTLPDARFPSVLPAVSAANLTNLPAGATPYGLFSKIDPTVVAWSKTGAFTMQTNTGLYIEVNGDIKTIASGTSITMPSATAGTDYAIWCTTAGALEATANHVSPPSANARKVGGFHYAPGGNATGFSTGGNTTPSINQYSFWDLKWRPSCSDPRGMTLIGGHFWSDIYITGVDHHTNGTSKYNVTIADGNSPPKIPTFYGGNGSTTYAEFNWFAGAEVLNSHGKRHPTYAEYPLLAYGSTENTSRGSDPVNTQMSSADAPFTSVWGVIQASGVMQAFGNNFGGESMNWGWQSGYTNGRGSTWELSPVVALGGGYMNSTYAGTRYSSWSSDVNHSYNGKSTRGVCNHLTSV